MIIQELEGEVQAHESCREDFVRAEELEDGRDRLEDELRFYQGRFKELSRQHRARERHEANGARAPATPRPSARASSARSTECAGGSGTSTRSSR